MPDEMQDAGNYFLMIAGRPYRAFYKRVSTEPLLYAIIVLDVSAPEPVGEWWL